MPAARRPDRLPQPPAEPQSSACPEPAAAIPRSLGIPSPSPGSSPQSPRPLPPGTVNKLGTSHRARAPVPESPSRDRSPYDVAAVWWKMFAQYQPAPEQTEGSIETGGVCSCGEAFPKIINPACSDGAATIKERANAN